MRAWGMNPDELLTREASTNPNATVIGQGRYEDNQIRQLSPSIKATDVKGNPRGIKIEVYKKKGMSCSLGLLYFVVF